MLDKIMGTLAGVKQSVKTVASDGSERLDILKMGVESAWAEIKTAVVTAAGPVGFQPEAATNGASDGAAPAANDDARHAA